MPPDADSPVRPQIFLMIVAGPVIGLVLGTLFAIALNSLRAARASGTSASVGVNH